MTMLTTRNALLLCALVVLLIVAVMLSADIDVANAAAEAARHKTH